MPAVDLAARGEQLQRPDAIDGPSMWKNRRAAGRVSEKPNPSAPSDAKSLRHPLPDLVLHRAHVVGDRDDRAAGVLAAAG